MKIQQYITLIFFLTGLLLFSRRADEAPASDLSLQRIATDPTASLMQLQVQNIYSGDYHNLQDKNGNLILIRFLAPFSTWSQEHLARASLSVITKSPSGKNGLNDLVIFDLLAFRESWGRWGIGPAVQFPTASDPKLGSEKWASGPVLGIESRSGKLTWSILSQSLFSFAGKEARKDIKNTVIQPILSYPLSESWSLGSSEMNFIYDWMKNDWTGLPVGIKLAKMVKYDKQYLQFSGAYEYNFDIDHTGAVWTLNFTVKYYFNN